MFPVPVLMAVIAILLVLYLHFSMRWSELYRRTEKLFHGPKPYPLVENGFEFSTDPQKSYEKIIKLANTFDRFFRVFLGGKTFIVLYDYRDAEALLSSTVKLEKNYVYKFLYPWIGTGLLTSCGEKWKSHRRIITPAFHFKVIEPYVDLFNENGALLCDVLSEKVGSGTFNVHEIVKLYALDNICETAMKIKINALKNSESNYVKAIKEIAELITTRAFSFWLYNDTIYNASKYGSRQRKALDVILGTTRTVVKERRNELSIEELEERNVSKENDGLYTKKRMAFLDVLLSSAEGSLLSDEDICEEVSTFMFEGHDTVSSGIAFALYALAHNQEAQEEAYQEQISMFGDSDRLPTYAELLDMKYLDMVLKEAQRLYPSVPMFGRKLNEDLQLSDGFVLPKGCQVILFVAQLHRDPKVWPEPEKFNPYNFLPDAVALRSPFAHVPFSAGARNCIGQRFAVLEMKSCISKVLRKFKLLPSPDPKDEIKLYGALVLNSKNGINIQIENRK